MKTVAIAALVGIAAFASQAEARTSGVSGMRSAGTLTCNVDPGVGLVFGSVRHVECSHAYKNRKGRIVRESYAGGMKRVGIDLGLTSAQTVSWKVKTSGFRPHRGMLSGAMVGTSSDASIMLGAGTYSAVGYYGGAVTLQPATTSGQVGFGFGLGETELELRKTPRTAFSALYY
jgi:hypothetical protein